MDSYKERLGAAVFIAGPIGLLWWSDTSRTGLLAAAAVLWIGAVALFVGTGTLRLFGPVLSYDLIRLGRSRGTFRLRTGLVLLLGTVVSLIYYFTLLEFDRRYGGGPVPLRMQSEVGQMFFATVVGMQFGFIVLLTPGYVAGAVAEEKERRTLEYLLATDLRSLEILFGKLASRVAGLLMMTVASLPVLAVAQFFGGIDPNVLLVCYTGMVITILSFSAVSIFASVRARRARDAIGFTYVLIIGYLIGSFLAIELTSFGARRGLPTEVFGWEIDISEISRILADGNILWMFGRYQMATRFGSGATPGLLLDILRDYALFHGVVIALCLTFCAVRFRAIALFQLFGEGARRRWFRRDASTRTATPHAKVGNRPMMWKEIHVAGAGRGLMRGVWGILAMIVVSLIAPVVIVLHYYDDAKYNFDQFCLSLHDISRDVHGYTEFIGPLLVSFLFIRITISGAGSILGERDQHTLDELLTTPLTVPDILYGKWVGCILGVRRLWLLLGLIWFVAAVFGSLEWQMVPILLAYTAAYSGAYAWLGMYCSLTMRTTLRATFVAIVGSIVMLIGYILIFYGCVVTPLSYMDDWIDRSIGYMMDCSLSYSPPLVVADLTFAPFNHHRYSLESRDPESFYVHLVIGLVLTAGISFGLSRLCLRKFARMANRDAKKQKLLE